MEFNFVKNAKYAYIFSAIIFLIGIIAIVKNGMVMDIDFKGGNNVQINIGQEFELKDISQMVEEIVGDKTATIQKVGDDQLSVSITTQITADSEVDEQKRTELVNAIKEKYGVTEEPVYKTVQPLFGSELQKRAIISVILSVILILAYVGVRFSRISGLFAGFTGIVALIHDVFVVIAIYAIFRIPVNSNFVAAILTILGYSINDTIIIYDRVRENKNLLRKASNEELVNMSIMQTLRRSIFTVITVFIAVITLYVFASRNNLSSITEFIFPLLVGLVSGSYSTIFICGPLWTAFQNHKQSTKKVRR